jgi:hypothetical protein
MGTFVYSQEPYEEEITALPILQERKLRPGQEKQLTQGRLL